MWKVLPDSDPNFICPKSFDTPLLLDMHVTLQHIDLNKQPWICYWKECERCLQPFENEVGLKGHISEHTGGKQYICSAKDCGLKFTTENVMTNHYQMVHGDGKY